nr:hypothetical protein [Tanacetum cinerariifolium]
MLCASVSVTHHEKAIEEAPLLVKEISIIVQDIEKDDTLTAKGGLKEVPSMPFSKAQVLPTIFLLDFLKPIATGLTSYKGVGEGCPTKKAGTKQSAIVDCDLSALDPSNSLRSAKIKVYDYQDDTWKVVLGGPILLGLVKIKYSGERIWLHLLEDVVSLHQQS